MQTNYKTRRFWKQVLAEFSNYPQSYICHSSPTFKELWDVSDWTKGSFRTFCADHAQKFFRPGDVNIYRNNTVLFYSKFEQNHNARLQFLTHMAALPAKQLTKGITNAN